MKIGIDARMCGPNVGGGGLGRYVEQLVDHLLKIDQKNRYVLFIKYKAISDERLAVSKIQEIITPIHWYTFKEQILLAPIINKQKLDLVHFPHWNVPIGLKTPFVVTIHDLILLEEPRSARATTKHPLIYALKYQGFKKVLSNAINKSKKIIAVSQATKNDILKYFPNIDPDKIVVIYEGVTKLDRSLTLQPYNPTTLFHFLLHIGNCYPHKNLERLLNAFEIIHKQIPELHLVIAGRKDVFMKRLKNIANEKVSSSFIHFEENPSDERLSELYSQAKLYVFPSLIEGFGLPAIEAMQMSLPVVCSDIPSLKEIANDAAIYFKKDDPNDIARVIQQILNDQNKQKELIEKGLERIKLYSWEKMAKEIVNVYQTCEN